MLNMMVDLLLSGWTIGGFLSIIFIIIIWDIWATIAKVDQIISEDTLDMEDHVDKGKSVVFPIKLDV